MPERTGLRRRRGVRPAVTLACGTVLTQDTILTADLVGCPGSALIVGADGITVDLGGFALDGRLPPSR